MVPCALTQISTALLHIAHTLLMQVPTNCLPFENENICYFRHGTHCFCFVTNLLKTNHSGFMTFHHIFIIPFILEINNSFTTNGIPKNLWQCLNLQLNTIHLFEVVHQNKEASCSNAACQSCIRWVAMTIYKFYAEIKRCG